MPMRSNSRNLKRLVALMAAMAMAFAIAMAVGAGALGAGFVLVGAAFAPCVWARPPGTRSGHNAHRSKNTAPNFWNTGQSVGDCSTSTMNCDVRSAGWVRKNRFAMSMAFHGDRICTGSLRGNATTARGSPASSLLPFVTSSPSPVSTMFNIPCSAQSMANMRASPTTAGTALCTGKLIDFGLTHYRARDRDFAATMVAA